MPIFDQGYQHWKGTLSGHAWRWLTVTRHGVRAQLKNRWTRIVMLFAWVPAAGLVAALALWGLAERNADMLPSIARFFNLPPESTRSPQSFRFIVWTYAYHIFFMVEVNFSMLLVLLVGPDLISQDLRFNALPLYFSRPLRRVDYFLGKLGIIVFCLSAVMVVPAVVAYLLGLAFSRDLGTIKDTFHLLPAAFAYGALVAVVAGTVMLGLSSLSRNARYVGAFWLGLWFVGNALASAFTYGARVEWGPLLSLTGTPERAGNLERVGDALLNLESARQQFEHLTQMPRQPRPAQYMEQFPEPPWTWSALVLLGLIGLSLWILSSRVKSLDRLK
ncbi:MAG: ABC transporter permease subunit [Planctomycetes bacterium]|nr:ABC transporter permease subunit [Planctomycetota bacterium]